ncbi:TniB family NTP-binding protein [Peribacillus frigoritolerans]|uniref:TniB family NTP-binding protein n=1 Tax=Peribacillus frigoritolerans TaxID=450367 RepID=UPI002E24F578|nr:TniB family NTP-binding protein [Peribacillus frigoritolerans]
MENRKFPEELLFGKAEERWNFFWNYPLDHPKFTDAFNKLMRQIDVSQNNDSVILLYGPTRVGKSFLAEQIFKAVNDKYHKEMQEDKGLIPAILVEASPPEKRHFDWQGFYITALEKLEDILIEHKVIPEMPKGGYKKAREYRKTSTLNMALISAIINRKTKVLIIDEAHHMAKRLTTENLQNQMDVLKTLANKTKIPIVLLGTYELQNFKDQSGQLASRGMNNHFTRYRYDNEEERMKFILCLLSFQQLLPLKIEPSLVEHYKFFYSRTLGCVGQLKNLFYLSFRGKLQENPNIETMELSDFEEYALTLDQCEKIREEIVTGEKDEKSSMSEQSLFRNLGISEDEVDELESKGIKDMENIIEKKTREEEPTKEVNRKTKNKQKGKPFQRNPKRDSIDTPEGFDSLKRAID